MEKTISEKTQTHSETTNKDWKFRKKQMTYI